MIAEGRHPPEEHSEIWHAHHTAADGVLLVLMGTPKNSGSQQIVVAGVAGQTEYHELTAQQRVQIAVLLCNLASSAACTRTQLTDAEDSRKEMRKEQLALKTKLRR